MNSINSQKPKQKQPHKDSAEKPRLLTASELREGAKESLRKAGFGHLIWKPGMPVKKPNLNPV